MKPITIKISNGTTQNISQIIDPATVESVLDTILDPEIQKNGAVISLPDGVEGIYGSCITLNIPSIPALEDNGTIILDDIAIKVNNLLRTIELFKSDKKDITVVNKSLKALQWLIIEKISGKSGILCRDIIGHRMKYSGRAVLVPSSHNNPELVEVPRIIFKRLGLKENDLIIIGRDPTIWHGSIEVLKAIEVDRNAIGLHPLIFKQLGADCDGDTVWIYKVPETPECQAEAQANLLSFCQDYIKTIKVSSAGLPPIIINKDLQNETIRESLNKVNGFSIGPIDILEQNTKVEQFKTSTGKDVGIEAAKICQGQDLKTIIDYLTSINTAMLVQKIYLGPVGAASQKLKLIAGNHVKELKDSANYLSERAQQMLFDVKGVVKGDERDLIIFLDLLDLINIQRDYQTTERRNIGATYVLQKLAEYGLDANKCGPIIRTIYNVYPITVALKILSNNVDTSLCNELLVNHIKTGENDGLLRKISEIANVSFEDLTININRAKRYSNLSKILDDSIYAIMNPFSEKKLIENISLLSESLDQTSKNGNLTDYIFHKTVEKTNV